VKKKEKKIYIDKLLIAIVAAKADENATWEVYFKSASSLNNAKDDLNTKRAAYDLEKSRRSEENVLLDLIAKMFQE